MVKKTRNKKKQKNKTRRSFKQKGGELFMILGLIVSIGYLILYIGDEAAKKADNERKNIRKGGGITSRLHESLSTFSKINIREIKNTGTKVEDIMLNYEGINFKLYETNVRMSVIHYVLVPNDDKEDNYIISKQMTVLLNVLLNNVKDNYYLTKCKDYLKEININDTIEKHTGQINSMLKYVGMGITAESLDAEKIKKTIDDIDWLNDNVINKVTKCKDKGVKYLKKFVNRVNLYTKSIQ
jgi:hypothetical protein